VRGAFEDDGRGICLEPDLEGHRVDRATIKAPTTAVNPSGFSYQSVESGYFEQRRLQRHAGFLTLLILGVGAVVAGQYSGWNLGLSQGFGGMFLALLIIAVMYLFLCSSIGEMAAALPHTGGAYSFARTTMGPWGLSGCVAPPGRDDTRLRCSSQTYASTVRKLFDAKQWR